MFAAAYALAIEYTKPIVISSRTVDGKCNSGIGTYVIINEEGWFVTALHVLQMIRDYQKQVDEHKALVAKREEIENRTDIKKGEIMRLLNQNKIAPNMVTNYSTWFGYQNVELERYFALPTVDLGVGKLRNFSPDSVKAYPMFKDPSKGMMQGSSLCKLGFPFHSIEPTFEDGSFRLPAGSVPIPFFPMEGIYTRTVDVQSDNTYPFNTKYIETSSPGLRGQSGGPTFDVHGNVWAIQSSTVHLPLGFTPGANMTAKEAEHLKNQYLHVGWGIHSETIIGFLKQNNIKFNLSLS